MQETKYKFRGMTDEEKDQKLGELMNEGKAFTDNLVKYCVRIEAELVEARKEIEVLGKALSVAIETLGKIKDMGE